MSTKSDDDLWCDRFNECGGVYRLWGNAVQAHARARVKGWHIFEGFSMTGNWIRVVLCPKCVGSSRSRRIDPVPEVLEGQLELFAGDTDPGDL